MPPLHVIDVPGHTGHGVNGILYHLEAIFFFIKMFGNFLEQQVVFEDALDWLQQVGAQGQRVLQQLLPVPEELSLLLVPHALRQGGH